MNCDACGLECTFELILALGSAEGIDSYTCSQCVGVYYERC
jgi:hypothetical protein